MDIQLPLTSFSPATISKLTSQLSLKPGQQVDAQVVNSSQQSGGAAITLKLGNDTITLQSDLPINVTPGQNLQLQVVKVTPQVEFKLVNSTVELKTLSANPSAVSKALPDVRLTLLSTSLTSIKPEFTVSGGSSLPSSASSAQSSSAIVSNAAANLTPTLQTVTAKIISIQGDKIYCQLLPDENPTNVQTSLTLATNRGKPTTIVIDRAQLPQIALSAKNSTTPVATTLNNSRLSLPDAELLKIGQELKLQINQTTAPNLQFALLPYVGKPLDQQITELVKQLLPRHEQSPVLLNQLIKDLPQILNSPQLPNSLKTLATVLLDSLPAKEQLLIGPNLKQLLNNTGLLLEAKLASALDTGTTLDLSTDFKANLLKLVHLIKQELSAANTQIDTQVSLPENELLKNLQQKTENTLAKIALDQLNTLPTDESAKQLWTFDMPFMHKGQAENVNINIQWEKAKHQDNQQAPNWSVNITINPPNLGTIHCTIAYQNQILSTYFKSMQQKTTNLISEHLDDLQKQLEAAGLKTGHLIAQQGQAEQKPSPYLPTQKLFDEQA